MPVRLVQLVSADGQRTVAIADGSRARRVRGATSVYALARAAIAQQSTLMSAIEAAGYGEDIDLQAALRDGRVLTPIDHPDSAHLLLSGTGLTHLGSAEARDRMHAAAQAEQASDSLKMFRMGLEGGKPALGATGVQPEWFYKGDGRSLVAPEQVLPMPDFALDGGEEAELAGVYLVGDDGMPYRLGFALANEFSDHVTERTNYLYLAHSKLRPAALGPELLLGTPPSDIRGTVRIRRGAQILWARPFLTGEANMSHALHNLEHHHFKYPLFRRPGDVHVHFFGTATLSFGDGVRAEVGDVFEIEAAPFTLPLRNRLGRLAAPVPDVRVL
jgi:hypothetical protein